MAEELTPQQKRLNEAQEELTERLTDLRSDLSTMKSDFSSFRSAMSDMTRSISQLKNPFLSHAASIIESIATYQQKTQLQKQEIEVTKSQIAQAQLAILEAKAAQQARQDDYNFLLEKQGAYQEVANAAQEQAEVLRKRNEQIESELDSAGKNIPEQATLAQQQLDAQKSEIQRLKDIAAMPISNKEMGLIDPSLANMTKDGLQQRIASLEEAASAQESEVARLNELTQLQEEQKENKRLISAADKRYAYNQERASDMNDEVFSAQKVLTDAMKEAEEVEKQKNKEVEKLNTELQKQQKELKIGAWRELSKIIVSVGSALTDFVKTVRDTQNKLGISSTNAIDVIMGNFAQSVGSFFTNATTVTGEEILAAQEAFRAEFGGVVTSSAAKDLAIQAKELGVTGQELAQARRVFMTTSMGNVGEAKAQTDRFVAEFQKRGLTSKDAMEAITKNSELFARNGNRFAQSFVRAAAEAKKIGVDLGKIDQVGDNIIGDFEGFLTKMSELGAMGFGFDSQRLAEIAEGGDTGALMNELRSQLAAQGKDLTNLRRSEQLALSQAFGVSMAELQRMSAPTEGSGEQLTEQEQTNSLLTVIADKLGNVATILGGVMGVLAGVQTALLYRIVANTGSSGGVIKTLFGGGKGTTAGGGATAGTAAAGTRISEAAGTSLPSGGMLSGLGSGLQGLAAGVSAFANGPALLGLAAVTASIIGLGFALRIAAPGIEAIGKALKSAFEGIGTIIASAGEALGSMFEGLAELKPSQMLALAVTMPILATSLGLFAITSLAAAPGLFIFTNRITKLAELAPGIQLLTTSFTQLNTAILAFNNIDTEKLARVKEITTPNVTTGITNMANAAAGIMTSATSLLTKGESTSPTPQVNVDLAPLEKKLDGVVAAIGRMSVQLDGNKVGRVVANTVSSTSQVGVLARSS